MKKADLPLGVRIHLDTKTLTGAYFVSLLAAGLSKDHLLAVYLPLAYQQRWAKKYLQGGGR